MTPLRYHVRSEDHGRFARTVWLVVDVQSGLDVTGPRMSEESAQAEADRKNGEALRLEHDAKVGSPRA